jgi:hypothetical protein
MARMFPAVYAPSNGDASERRLFARVQRELDGNWQAVHAGGRGFILLHRDLGIALLTLPGGTAPSVMVEEMRDRLDEIGFTRNFQGDIAIVAESLDPLDRRDLFAVLASGFAAAAPATPVDPTWPDWLLQRLLGETPAAPSRGAPGPTALRAPERAESWRTAAPPPAVAPEGAVRVVPEQRLHAEDLDTRSPLWTGMALAICVVAIVLVAMALLSHGRSPGGGPAPATTSAR